MTTFYTCKKFYDKTPDHELEPVLEQYKSYLKSIKRDMRKRRYEDKGTLKRLQNQHPEDDINLLKGALHKAYLEDYPETQYDDNPYLNLDEDSDTDDSVQHNE